MCPSLLLLSNMEPIEVVSSLHESDYGVDTSLPDERKLPILYQGAVPAAIDMVKVTAVTWAYKQLREPNARSLLVNGVSVAIDLGLICEVRAGQDTLTGATTSHNASGFPDGDWKRVQIEESPNYSQEEIQAAKSVLNREEMEKAGPIIITTKINWWIINHRTGHGKVQGFVKYALECFYPDAVSNELITAVHSLGHYTSTLRFTSSLAGIVHTRVAVPIFSFPGAWIAVADNLKVGLRAMPAGTHKLTIAFEAAKILVGSTYARFCPGIKDFIILSLMKEAIKCDPARYHINAFYLTGTPRVQICSDIESFLGRLGTFIIIIYGNSILAKSPYMQASRIVSYKDYDINFQNTLIIIKRLEAMGRIDEAQEFQITSDMDISEVKAYFFDTVAATQPSFPAPSNCSEQDTK